MTYDSWDVVVTPFPFTDGPDIKRRPALVLSPSDFNDRGFALMAMITTADDSSWPGDVRLDHTAAGLKHACLARMKLFTIDVRLFVKKVGSLSAGDRQKITVELKKLLPV